VGGLKDLVINGVTGFLVEPTNTKELAEKMLYLLDNNDKAKEMGVKARRLVEEKFSIDKVVSQLEILYEEVLKEWRRSE
jgi:glycosyltransferase involved in cell wall biosynthesis